MADAGSRRIALGFRGLVGPIWGTGRLSIFSAFANYNLNANHYYDSNDNIVTDYNANANDH